MRTASFGRSAAAAIVIAGRRGHRPARHRAAATSRPRPCRHSLQRRERHRRPRPATVAKPAAPAGRAQLRVVTVDPHGQAVIAGRSAPGDRVRILDRRQDARRGDRRFARRVGAGAEHADAAGRPPAAALRRPALMAARRAARTTSSRCRSFGRLPPGASRRRSRCCCRATPTQPARVLQVPAWAASIQKLLSLDTASYGAEHGWCCRATPCRAPRLRLYAGNQLLGTVTADAAGRLVARRAQALPAGGFELLARTARRRRHRREPHRRAVRAARPPWRWPKAAATSCRGQQLAGSSRANPMARARATRHLFGHRGQIGNPNLIFPGQQLQGAEILGP